MSFDRIKYALFMLIVQSAYAMQEGNQLTRRKAPSAVEMREPGDKRISVWPHLSNAQKIEVDTQISWFKAGVCCVGAGALLKCCESEPVTSCVANSVGTYCGYPLTGECNRCVLTAHWTLQFFGLLVAGASYCRIRKIKEKCISTLE